MKKNLFRTGILVLLLSTLLVSLMEGGSKRRRGTAGAQELLIPSGSRGTALAGAYMAGLSGIEAAEWNVAGVAGMDGTGEVMFSQLDWIAGINVSYFGAAATVGGKNIFGVTFKSLDFGDIPVTTMEATAGTGEMYSPSYITLGFLYSRRMTDRIFFGADVKLVSETIMRENATGMVMDAGVQYQTGSFRLGASLRNLGLNMIFTGSDLEQFQPPFGSEPGTPTEPLRVPLQEFEMPTTLELGTSYGPVNLGVAKVTTAFSFLNNNFGFDEYRFGVEAVVMEMISLRSGFTQGYDPEPYGEDWIQDTNDDKEDNQWESNTEEFIWGSSFGFGLDLSKFTGIGLSVDYAYRTTHIFDGVSWLTFKVAF